MTGTIASTSQYSTNTSSPYSGKAIDPNDFAPNYSDYEYVKPLDSKYYNSDYVQIGGTIYYNNNARPPMKSDNHIVDPTFVYHYNTEMYLRLLNYDSPLAEKARQVSTSVSECNFTGMSDQEVYNTVNQMYKDAFGDEFWIRSSQLYVDNPDSKMGWTTVNMWFDNDIREHTGSSDLVAMRRMSEYGHASDTELKETIYAKYGDLRNITRSDLQALVQELSEYNLVSDKEAFCLLGSEGIIQYSPPGSPNRNISRLPTDRINVIEGLYRSIAVHKMTEYEAIFEAVYKDLLLRYPFDDR